MKNVFFNASIGWIKYKPLFLYITQKESYRQLIEEAMEKLQRSIPKMNQLFKNSDFICLLDTLQSYNEQVESHYEEYVETNRVWNLLKEDIEIEKITRRIQHVQNSNYCTNV